MNITHFVDYLNKRKKLHIDTSYYANIDTWKDWWEGYVKNFHTIKETAVDGSTISRDMASLRMAKQVCEDWATLLLNDKTTVSLGDEASAQWLLGNADQTGGVLRELRFWPEANRLVELAMRSGTGAFVMSVEGLQLANGAIQPSPKAVIRMDYNPAECILPITVSHGVIREVAFASAQTVNGLACIYLQTHRLVPHPDGGQQYRITNEYFTGENGDLDGTDFQPAPLPKGILASMDTGSDIPWFSIFSPAVVKNLRGGPGLGMAVFSEAVAALCHVDLAFDNYDQDLFLGGKKVFYNKALVRTWIDDNGREHAVTPDQVRRQMFYQLPEENPDAVADWHEYNPDLRVEANGKAVQDALDYLSFKVGLGTRHYQFSGGNVTTATQYNGDRQDMVQHANRHQIQIEAALIQIFRAILWAGKTLLGQPVNPDTTITVQFDDSYITDTETRRALLKDDALQGLLPKYRYLMEAYGVSEEKAKALVEEARLENQSEEPLSFGNG